MGDKKKVGAFFEQASAHGGIIGQTSFSKRSQVTKGRLIIFSLIIVVAYMFSTLLHSIMASLYDRLFFPPPNYIGYRSLSKLILIIFKMKPINRLWRFDHLSPFNSASIGHV